MLKSHSKSLQSGTLFVGSSAQYIKHRAIDGQHRRWHKWGLNQDSATRRGIREDDDDGTHMQMGWFFRSFVVNFNSTPLRSTPVGWQETKVHRGQQHSPLLFGAECKCTQNSQHRQHQQQHKTGSSAKKKSVSKVHSNPPLLSSRWNAFAQCNPPLAPLFFTSAVDSTIIIHEANLLQRYTQHAHTLAHLCRSLRMGCFDEKKCWMGKKGSIDRPKVMRNFWSLTWFYSEQNSIA